MFIWDFLLSDIMDQLIDWLYINIISFLSDFFAQMGNMGVELFNISWVQSIVLFFSYLGLTLYLVGVVVSAFELGIDYQNGKGSVRETLLNILKGFFAVSLFTILPIRLFELSINLQSSLTTGLIGNVKNFSQVANEIMSTLATDGIQSTSAILGGLNSMSNQLFKLFIVIMIGYAVIKVFFANLKRGGILLIQIAVGSLYMFSVPRGYFDGFIQWCKQIIGLCLTTFLQSTMLIAGLLVLKDNCLLGLGLMLASGEVPRIAGAFGLDTSTKANVTGAVYAVGSAVNTTKTVVQAIAK